MTSPPVIGFVLLALYYLLVYLMTRRRSNGPIVPRNAPPDGISAAGVRYILRKGVDDKNFVIAILELIALRALRIKHNFDRANSVRFEQLVPDDQGRQGLQRAPLLTLLLDTMFGTYNRFVRGTRGDARLRAAQNTLTAQLHLQHSDFLATNENYARWGTGLWLLYTATCLTNVIIQSNRDGDAVFALMALLIGMALLTFSYGQWRERGTHWGSAILSIVFGVPILIAGIAACVKASAGEPVPMLSVLLPALLLPIVRRAFVFLRSYTEAGSALMESIAGFKQTLMSASTGSWLGALATQDDKLRLYERYLPYAIALDIGQRWVSAFDGLANSTALQTRAQSYGIDPTTLFNPSQTVRDVGRLVTPAPAAGTSTSHATSGGESGWYGGGESSGGFFSWGGSGDGGGGDGGGGSD